MSIVSVYAIFADSSEAERIAALVVEERLAACANILGPCRSFYRWQGKVESADEVATLFKTTTAKADALVKRIAGLHSYDVPCVAAWPVSEACESYSAWVEGSVGGAG